MTDAPSLTAADVVRLLSLHPLAGEGGMWAQTHRDAHGSGIYFLLQPGDFSALHRLQDVEVYHHYAGAPAELVVIEPEGRLTTHVLGDDMAAGQRPVAVVGANMWQGSRTRGAWTLLGATMAPPYRPSSFTLGRRADLLADFPHHASLITALTRP